MSTQTNKATITLSVGDILHLNQDEYKIIEIAEDLETGEHRIKAYRKFSKGVMIKTIKSNK